MPVYEYRCDRCGARFSRLSRHVSDAAAPACPTCGAAESRRLVSSFAIKRSLKSQIESIDPRIERELDAVDTVKRDPLAGLNLDYPSGNSD